MVANEIQETGLPCKISASTKIKGRTQNIKVNHLVAKKKQKQTLYSYLMAE